MLLVLLLASVPRSRQNRVSTFAPSMCNYLMGRVLVIIQTELIDTIFKSRRGRAERNRSTRCQTKGRIEHTYGRVEWLYCC